MSEQVAKIISTALVGLRLAGRPMSKTQHRGCTIRDLELETGTSNRHARLILESLAEAGKVLRIDGRGTAAVWFILPDEIDPT